MNLHLSAPQQRGLILLIAFALVASGLALFSPRLRAPSLGLSDPIEISGARILLPVFLDTEGRINLNTASAEELTALPGIGEVLAARIVAYRQEHGPFARIEALNQISGIGDRLVERIRDLVVLEN